MDTREKKKSTSKKIVDGRSTSSHDSKKFRTRSMEKQGGIAFGYRKTASAVIKPDGNSSVTCTRKCYTCLLRNNSFFEYVSKVKIKLPLFTSQRYIGGEEAQLHSFSNYVIDNGECLSSRPGHVALGKIH
jgi:hypothetical protein